MDLDKRYTELSIKTADNLKSVAQSLLKRIPSERPPGEMPSTRLDLSRRSLKVDDMVDQVAQLVPAGNLPGLLLSGLARLSERRLPQKKVRGDINLLFKGVEQTLDKAMYGAFFAGPAAIIRAYQNLLRLSGKAPQEAFPEGLWQFYVDYAMREDTARHANETIGFDLCLHDYQLHLPQAERATAWVMTALWCLHHYDALLANEWRERVYTGLLANLTQADPHAARYAAAYRDWEKQRPFKRGDKDAAAHESYPAYRQRKFDQFLAEVTTYLSPELRARWLEEIQQAEADQLPAYQRQMSILAYLEPGPYEETRTPLALEQLCVGLIYRGRYYLIPACLPGTTEMPDIQTVRMMVTRIFVGTATDASVSLTPLAELRRAAWPELRQKLNGQLRQALNRLRMAPILLNCDFRPHSLILSELRQTERGVGDHALTLIDTGESMVFDQSHIFFDGGWGAALAEILTGEALAWARYLNASTGTGYFSRQQPEALTFTFGADDLNLIRSAPRVATEVGAETEKVELKPILRLRYEFKQRHEQLQLTVNDLLILYRAVHAATYQPDPKLVAELEKLTQLKTARPAAEAAMEALNSAQRVNPSLVMPVDATRHNPRDRLYPITFEVPLNDLDLLDYHEQVLAALARYKQATGDRSAAYAEFDRLQRNYLERLGAFAVWLGGAKRIANAGESFSIGNINLLLGHLPTPLQRLLDKLPERFDLLNDLIKGREAFSNVGVVAPSSSLIRFISAKDDNEKKSLIWGVITDAKGIMRISLRDFRPHAGLLVAAGYKELAGRITRHYLDSYAIGLNQFVGELRLITQTSRETRLGR